MTPILEFKGVSKGYGEGLSRDEVLKSINLSVRDGEFLAILGFSGTGKTTLINLMAGLAAPDRGEVLFAGRPVTGPGWTRSTRARAAPSAGTWSRNTCAWSASGTPSTGGRRSCRGGCASGLRSPARWRCSRRCCCSTSRSRRWTR